MKSERHSPKAENMQAAIRQAVRAVPRGKVATYGQIAEAAGYPRYHRQVAQVLSRAGDTLVWHRIVGSGGELKTGLESRLEQRMRLEMEGVRFRGRRVDMAQHQYSSLTAQEKRPRRRT